MYSSGSLSFSKERHSFVIFADKEIGTYKDDDIEILQYTGQKDGNNKEVYQRDIIEVEDSRYVVIWDNNRGGVVLYRCGEKDPDCRIWKNRSE